MDECQKCDKQAAEIRRLVEVRDESLRVRKEEEKKFVGGGVMKLPHVKLGLNLSGRKTREYQFVLRPSMTEEIPKHVIPTLEILKGQKNIRDPFMIEMCKDVKPWEEVLPKALYNTLVYYVIFCS